MPKAKARRVLPILGLVVTLIGGVLRLSACGCVPVDVVELPLDRVPTEVVEAARLAVPGISPATVERKSMYSTAFSYRFPTAATQIPGVMVTRAGRRWVARIETDEADDGPRLLPIDRAD